MMRLSRWSRTVPIALAFTLACAGSPTPRGPMPAGLTGINWRLITLEGRSPAVSATGIDPSLTLTTNYGVTGYSGCNQFTGSYSIQGDSLRLGALTAAGTACAGNMALEQKYLAALRATDRYQVTADSLILFQRAAPGLVYKR